MRQIGLQVPGVGLLEIGEGFCGAEGPVLKQWEGTWVWETGGWLKGLDVHRTGLKGADVTGLRGARGDL
jgi:hypothetical protein